MAKSTKTKSKVRIACAADVIQLYFTGWSPEEVCQENPGATILADRARELMQRQVDTYLTNALAEHVIARRAIRKKGFALASDGGGVPALRLALDALKDEAKLLGLYRTPLTARLEALEGKLA